MDYLVVMSEDGELINVTVEGVEEILVNDGAYGLVDKNERMLFTSPMDSVVYIQSKETIH